MIALIEGVDRTGKGTLCQRLRSDLPHFHYIHFGVPNLPDAYEYFANGLQGVTDLNLIVDRLHWSNHAYNGRFGGSVLTDFDWWRLDQWLAQQPSVAILLVDDPHAIHARLLDEARATNARVGLTPQEVGELQNAFNRCFDRSVIGNKWSFGLDQLFDLSVDPPTPKETYLRLLKVLRGEEIEE